MIHGEPAYIPTEVVTMSPALFYALLAQAWDEGVEAGELYQFKVSRFLRGDPDPYPDDLANPYRANQIEGDNVE